MGRLKPSRPESRPGADLRGDGWDGWDGSPLPNDDPSRAPNDQPGSYRPAESHRDAFAYGSTFTCPRSWLYDALSGPLYGNLPHRVIDVRAITDRPRKPHRNEIRGLRDARYTPTGGPQ
ncbi:hypothetical protein GCM10009687_54150 [Asanoa iriomotensis]|uniref:Uncharacterized protein n=1 Tax=Asanoa iriomotensis TaxID=234613 RepID=A0ABQ4CG65_9ACTN|nr:hypothetical protein Air01nite_78520 [Asanoa iriomotensis]